MASSGHLPSQTNTRATSSGLCKTRTERNNKTELIRDNHLAATDSSLGSDPSVLQRPTETVMRPLPRMQSGQESLVPFHFNDATRWLLTIQFTPAALKAVPNGWLPSNDIAGRAGPHFHTVIPSCLNYWQGSSPMPIQVWESRPLFCLLMGTVFPFPILVLQGSAFWTQKDVLMRDNVSIFICRTNRCSCPAPVSYEELTKHFQTYCCIWWRHSGELWNFTHAWKSSVFVTGHSAPHCGNDNSRLLDICFPIAFLIEITPKGTKSFMVAQESFITGMAYYTIPGH